MRKLMYNGKIDDEDLDGFYWPGYHAEEREIVNSEGYKQYLKNFKDKYSFDKAVNEYAEYLLGKKKYVPDDE